MTINCSPKKPYCSCTFRSFSQHWSFQNSSELSFIYARPSVFPFLFPSRKAVVSLSWHQVSGNEQPGQMSSLTKGWHVEIEQKWKLHGHNEYSTVHATSAQKNPMGQIKPRALWGDRAVCRPNPANKIKHYCHVLGIYFLSLDRGKFVAWC